MFRLQNQSLRREKSIRNQAAESKIIIFRLDGVLCPIIYHVTAPILLNMAHKILQPCLSGHNLVTLFGINCNDCFIVSHHVKVDKEWEALSTHGGCIYSTE